MSHQKKNVQSVYPPVEPHTYTLARLLDLLHMRPRERERGRESLEVVNWHPTQILSHYHLCLDQRAEILYIPVRVEFA